MLSFEDKTLIKHFLSQKFKICAKLETFLFMKYA